MNSNPFCSFWMGGYECADHLNAFGNRVDLLRETGHLLMAKEDYGCLEALKIKTVREGLRWSVLEKQPYVYDFEPARLLIETGVRAGIQQLWDICHFGFPDDLTPLHPMFARRFASFCRAFVEFYRSISPNDTLVITPINEVNFLSWLGGEARGTSPYCQRQGWEVKYALMRAYIEGIEEMKRVDNRIRILVTEPLVNIVTAHPESEELLCRAAKEHEFQFQVYDILSGRACPELRGRPEYLDIIGLNFYPNNQWCVESGVPLFWSPFEREEGWVDLHELLIDVHRRYERPFILSETSGTEDMRADWIRYIGEEASLVLAQRLPFWGICLYPIIDRPDWDAPEKWHRAGIWKVDENNRLARSLQPELAEMLIQMQWYVSETAWKFQYAEEWVELVDALL